MITNPQTDKHLSINMRLKQFITYYKLQYKSNYVYSSVLMKMFKLVIITQDSCQIIVIFSMLQRYVYYWDS